MYFYDLDYDICGDEAIFFGNKPITVSSQPSNQETYRRDKDCDVQLSTATDRIFKIEILRFQLERKKSDDECNDFLEISSGDDRNSAEIVKLCGAKPKRSVRYTDMNKLKLRFKSNEKLQERGFKLRISTVEKPRSFSDYDSGMACCFYCLIS